MTVAIGICVILTRSLIGVSLQGFSSFSQLSGGVLPRPTKATGNRRSMNFAHGLHHACFHQDQQVKNNATQMGTSGMTRSAA
ncbi:hypothetical protein D3C79_423500 [compost metagenome]